MRVALYGGTFDPVHNGHLLCAESAREAFKLDRILFLPSAVPPHKPHARAFVRHRIRMVKQAIQGNSAFGVSTWEADQKRAVYTHETLAHFKSQFKTLFFIVGSDSLAHIDSWRSGRAVLRQATFLVAERPDTPWESISASLRRSAKRIPHPPVSFSSHDIRARVRSKRTIRYHVPESVRRYIATHKLYAA